MSEILSPAAKAVSHDEWIAARKQLLVKEKEYSRLGDDLARLRRELPWELVTKEYLFDGPAGKETLAQLFAGHSQFAVYHFMFGPDWEAGCPSCSFWADNFNGIDVHLAARDVTLVAISHARSPSWKPSGAGWVGVSKWVSAGENGFNYDYHVSFKPDEVAKGEIYYNYRMLKRPIAELPGISAFYQDPGGAIYHTYSGYERGVETVNGTYHWLDLMPKGRDEKGLSFSMSWVRHHDRYDGDWRGPGEPDSEPRLFKAPENAPHAPADYLCGSAALTDVGAC